MYPRFGTDDADGKHRTNVKVAKVWMGRILATAISAALLTAQAWAADPEDLRRICTSGTVGELRTALRLCSADEPFPDGNRPLQYLPHQIPKNHPVLFQVKFCLL